jgi:hypothetical protein
LSPISFLSIHQNIQSFSIFKLFKQSLITLLPSNKNHQPNLKMGIVAPRRSAQRDVSGGMGCTVQRDVSGGMGCTVQRDVSGGMGCTVQRGVSGGMGCTVQRGVSGGMGCTIQRS